MLGRHNKVESIYIYYICVCVCVCVYVEVPVERALATRGWRKDAREAR